MIFFVITMLYVSSGVMKWWTHGLFSKIKGFEFEQADRNAIRFTTLPYLTNVR